MKLISLNVFLIIIFCTVQLCAQTYEGHLPKIIPSPPDAAALGRFGEYPVNLFRGEVNINIPILDYKVGNIAIPISLSYNSSGFRVDELATNVGLGWALNAGGVITRNVKGQPDFKVIRKLPADIRNFNPNEYKPDYRLLDSVDKYKLDTEPDIFLYNFLNRSGKFVFLNDTTPVLIPFQKLRIGGVSKITDESGVQYLFTETESSVVEQQCTVGTENPRDFNGIYPSSWYLGKIIHPSGDTVTFEYETYYYQYEEGRTQVAIINSSIGGGEYVSFDDQNRDCISTRTVSAQRIKKIRSNRSDYYVEFIYNANQREDVYSFDTDHTYSSNYLEKIVLKSNSDTLKKITLSYDYFRSDGYNPNNPTREKALASRLKLISVQETGKTPYTFSYVDSVKLPPRLSFSQDHYGYYNGQPNGTLIPTNIGFEYAGADRTPNENYMVANVIRQITYPTGGYSEFTFESNKKGPKDSSFTINKQKLVSCNVGCPTRLDSFIVAEDAYNHNFSVSYNLPPPHCEGSITGPGYSLSLLNSGTNPIYPPLQPGKYYIEIDKNNNTIDNVYVNVYWAETHDSTIVSGYNTYGGLRIKSIKSYTDLNQTPIIRRYEYDYPDNAGVSSFFDLRNFNYVNEVRKAGTEYDNCNNYGICWIQTISANSIPFLNIDYYNSYGYQYVTEYINTSTNPGGKTVNKFSISVNDFEFDHAGDNIDRFIDWSKGLQLQSTIYKYNQSNSSYVPVSKTISKYKAYYKWEDFWESENGVLYASKNEKFIPALSYKRQIYGGLPTSGGPCTIWCPPGYEPLNFCSNDLLSFPYPEFEVENYFISSAWYHKSSDSVITYGQTNSDSIVSVSKEYYTDPVFAQLSYIETFDSKGNVIKTEYKYPHDFSGTLVYDTMVARNIITPVIEQKQYIGTSLRSRSLTNYKLWGNNITAPENIQLQIASNPLETRIQFLKYNATGNIMEQSKIDDIKLAYIYDYQSTYPIAETINADSVSIAYTSFEADGKGNWTFSGSSSTDATSPTGIKSYSLSGGSISKTGLNSLGNYIVSYWSKNGQQTVSNSGTSTTGRSVGSWTYYEHAVSNPSNGTITVSGSGTIDELRLYPKGALMTTYTYQPPIGVTSQCDANNRITYYEYDSFGRLKQIKDQDGNILKRMDYKYQATYQQ